MPAECEHQYVYLRQEKKNEGYDRNPTWCYYDVFFCERCLQYNRVKVRETVPSRQSFGEEDTTWRPGDAR